MLTWLYNILLFILNFFFFGFFLTYVEIYIQTQSQPHSWLDRSTKPFVGPASDRLPHPRERIGAGKAAEKPEAGDGELEPRLLDQAEHQLQQGEN